MQVRNLASTTVGLAAALALLAPPVLAQDLGLILQGILGRGAGAAADPQTIVSLNSTRVQLESMIASGLASGQISAAQAANLRMQLGSIANAQAGFMMDGHLSWPEVQNLVSRYTTLTAQVNASTNANVGWGGGGWQGGRGGGWQGGWRGSAQIDRMQAQITSRINRGIASGRLTNFEARRLLNELAQIQQLEARYQAGGLNRWEIANLTNRLENLSVRVDQQIRDRQFAGRDYWRWF